MRELLSPKNLDYQDRAREVAEKYVRPRAAELDRTGEYGWDILEALKSARAHRRSGSPRSTAARAPACSTCAWSSSSSPAPAAASAWPTPSTRSARSPSSSAAPTSRRRSTCRRIATGDSLIAFGLSEKAVRVRRRAACAPRRSATATTTSSTATRSGTPTAAWPRSTPSTP